MFQIKISLQSGKGFQMYVKSYRCNHDKELTTDVECRFKNMRKKLGQLTTSLTLVKPASKFYVGTVGWSGFLKNGFSQNTGVLKSWYKSQ
jgi:hypothetical protein